MLSALSGQHGWQLSSALASALRPNQSWTLLLGVILVYLPLAGPHWQQRFTQLAGWLALPLWLLAVWVLQGRTVVPFLYFQF